MIEGVFRAISLQTGYGDCRDFDPACPQWAEEGHCSRAKAFLLGGIGIMEKNMETTI